MSSPAAADPFVPRPCRGKKVRRELRDVTTLEITLTDGSRPTFLPGQFNMLYVFGVGEAAISVSGDAAAGECYVHTVRQVGAVSSAIASLKAGAMLGMRGPFGTGWPVEDAEGCDVVIVAGGLGLAPLRPAIYHVLANRARFGRVVLLYGTRSPADLLYRSEVERWRRRFDVEIEVTVDHAGSDWYGHVGVVPLLIPRLNFDPHSTLAMVCGPEIMMRFTATSLLDAGVAADHIYVSMERNMKCAVGLCGHCQFGPDFICKDGPVMRYDRIAGILAVREI